MKNLMQKIKSKVRTGMLGLGLAAGLAGLNGCENMNQYDASYYATEGLKSEAETPEQYLFLDIIGEIFKTQANREDRRGVAAQIQQESSSNTICVKIPPELVKEYVKRGDSGYIKRILYEDENTLIYINKFDRKLEVDKNNYRVVMKKR